MNEIHTEKINTLIAILHIKEAAKLLETSNLEISQALYNVAIQMINIEQISNDDVHNIVNIKNDLESKITYDE